jgi:hypothetical protein
MAAGTCETTSTESRCRSDIRSDVASYHDEPSTDGRLRVTAWPDGSVEVSLPIRSKLAAWNIRLWFALSARQRCHDLDVRIFLPGPDRDLLFEKVQNALGLISQYSFRQFQRIRQDLRGIWITETAGNLAEYEHAVGCAYLIERTCYGPTSVLPMSQRRSSTRRRTLVSGKPASDTSPRGVRVSRTSATEQKSPSLLGSLTVRRSSKKPEEISNAIQSFGLGPQPRNARSQNFANSEFQAG